MSDEVIDDWQREGNSPDWDVDTHVGDGGGEGGGEGAIVMDMFETPTTSGAICRHVSSAKGA